MGLDVQLRYGAMKCGMVTAFRTGQVYIYFHWEADRMLNDQMRSIDTGVHRSVRAIHR